jgi:uncharacterized protein (DUF2147 family)
MRVMKFIVPTAVALLSATVSLESAFAGSDPTGIWLDDTGRGAVEIKSCGNAMCGNVVWVKSSTDTDGCGKQIIGGVTSIGGGRWDNGWIYSPEKGRKYDVELVPMSNGNLKVVGYAGMKFLSKTMIWKPAPADLKLCGQTSDTNKKNDGATPPAAPNSGASASTQTSAQNANAESKTPPASAKAEAKAADKPTDQAQAPTAAPGKVQQQSDETAKADSDAQDDNNGDGGVGNLGKIKIGNLQLDKVLTKTKDGKCKLDLPWVKVTIDCEQD